MNHAVEYFHTLVEHKFQRDQYEVIYTEGKYHVTLTIPDKNPMSYYICTMYEKKMRQCVEGLIKPENFKLQVILPITLIKEKEKNLRYLERIKKILRVND